MTGNVRRMLVGAVLAMAALVGAGGSARANISLSLASVTPSGGGFTYTYTVFLQGNSALVPPPAAGQTVTPGNPNGDDLFTIYDVLGLNNASVSNTLSPGTWAAAIQLTGLTPITQTPTDLATVSNVTFEYLGPGNVINSTTVDLPLGTVSFESSFPVSSGANLEYSAATQRADSLTEIANNTSQLQGPAQTTGGVPEPATLVLLLTGLPVLGVIARRRKKQPA